MNDIALASILISLLAIFLSVWSMTVSYRTRKKRERFQQMQKDRAELNERIKTQERHGRKVNDWRKQ